MRRVGLAGLGLRAGWGLGLSFGLLAACGHNEREASSDGVAGSGVDGGSSSGTHATVGATAGNAGRAGGASLLPMTAGTGSGGDGGSAIAGNGGSTGSDGGSTGSDGGSGLPHGGSGSADVVVVCAGDRTINNRAQYQALVAEGCGEITGTLSIGAGDLSKAPGLTSLKKVGGSLSVSATFESPSLETLSQLQSVGQDLTIRANQALTNISGLSNLTHVGWSVYVRDNPKLHSVDGLGGLTELEGLELLGPFTSLAGLKLQSVASISLSETQLESLAGLENVTGLRWLSLFGNSKLESLVGLAASAHLDGLWLQYNAGLTSLAGLENLEEVVAPAGDPKPLGLLVQGNEALASLAGLEKLKHVDGLQIRDNAVLTSILALGSLTTVDDDLSIEKNPQLPQCQVDALDAQLDVSCTICDGNAAQGTCN